LESEHGKNSILVFDRGLNNRRVIDKIDENNYFITRLQKGYRVKQESIKKKEQKGEVGKEEVEITKEIKGYLYDRKDILCKNPYRIIHAKKKEEVWDEKKAKKVRCKILRKKHEGVSRKSLEEEQLKEELIVVTNLPEEEYGSREVLELYKKRWDIEVFFKFIKQELGFSHFLNRSENGIKVVMYIRMLFAILLLVYKMKNNLEGYKYVKSAMMRELEVEFIRYVIEKSGGKYDKWMKNTGSFW